MKVYVTAETFLFQAEEGVLSSLDLRIIDEFRFVTIAAIDPCMLTLEGIARLAMIELLLVEAHHVEFTPVMLTVTVDAIGRAHLFRGVIPPIVIDQELYFTMAGQAFFVRDFVADVMAFGTIADSL